MAAPRFFLTAPLEPAEAAIRLPMTPEDVHHVFTVLRLRRGDEIEVAEPFSGRVWGVRIEHASSIGVDGVPLLRLDVAPRPAVTLVQGVAKGEKMDAIVRQAVEIGAAEILPVLTERTVVRLDGSKRADKGERWRRVARAAAEQSHRDAVPPVADPVPLKHVLPLLAGFDAVVVLWEEAVSRGIECALEAVERESTTRVALVVGPEGGLSAQEVDALESVGAVQVTLGPGILRTETAAVVGLALVMHALGGLGRD